MSRLARIISPTGLYHIVFRGVNKQHIFEEDTDYLKLMQILEELKKGTKGDVPFLSRNAR